MDSLTSLVMHLAWHQANTHPHLFIPALPSSSLSFPTLFRRRPVTPPSCLCYVVPHSLAAPTLLGFLPRSCWNATLLIRSSGKSAEHTPSLADDRNIFQHANQILVGPSLRVLNSRREERTTRVVAVKFPRYLDWLQKHQGLHLQVFLG